MFDPTARRVSWRAMLALGLVIVGLAASARISLAQGPQVKNVVVAQVLGNQMGKYAAGKDTVIAVLLDQPTVADPATQQVVVKLGTDTVTTLQPTSLPAYPAALFFLCPSRAACGDWKAGDYTFEVKVGAATATANAQFQDRAGLSVILLPIKANYGPGDIRSTTGAWKNLLDFTKLVYPVAPDKWKVKLGHEIDASGDQYNTLTPEGRQALTLLVIEASQQRACFEEPRPTDILCYDSISGFVKDRLGPGGTLQGFAYKTVKTNINVESDADAAATVAHEIGHLYNLGDEYQGGAYNCPLNPPPAAYVGKDFNNPEVQNYSCKESKSGEPPQGYTGSVVAANADLPIDLSGRGPLPDMTSFMGNGPKQEGFWISPTNWAALFDALDPAKKTGALLFKNAAPANATQSRWIFALGTISKDDKVITLPWSSFMDNHSHTDSTGKVYSLRSVDASGKTLASDALNVEFGGLDNKGDADFGLFEVSVPFPESTAAFQIVKGDKVLKEIKVSANAPVVKITAPTAGEKITDTKYTFKWEASDKDGDKLYFDVEYSDNGQEWISIAENIEKSEVTVDLSDLPGSDKPTAQIIVSATDGVNATDVTSEMFALAPRAPLVGIDVPPANAAYKVGALVTLQGGAYDYQDDEITDDNNLVWSSDLQGELGKGETLNLSNLKEGVHVIKLTATNSFKVSGSSTITIYVGVPAPTPTPTVAPSATVTPSPTPKP